LYRDAIVQKVLIGAQFATAIEFAALDRVTALTLCVTGTPARTNCICSCLKRDRIELVRLPRSLAHYFLLRMPGDAGTVGTDIAARRIAAAGQSHRDQRRDKQFFQFLYPEPGMI
jgi:hypothetical protein